MIYPSDLARPYQVDLTNTLAARLVSQQVSIYIVEPGSAVATDVQSGATLPGVEVEANRRALEVNGYSIAYDYSGLTAAEKSDLDADPFQVLQAQEDEIKAHFLGMEFQTDSLKLPINGIYELTIHFVDGTTEFLSGSGSVNYNGRYNPDIAYIVGFDADGNLYFDCNQHHDPGYVPELIQGKHGFISGWNNFTGPSLAYPPINGGLTFGGHYGNGGGQFKYTAQIGTVIEFDFIPTAGLGSANAFLGRNSNYGYFQLLDGKIKKRLSGVDEETVANDIYTPGERLRLAIATGDGEWSVYKNSTLIESVTDLSYLMPGRIYTGVGDRFNAFKGQVFSIKVYSGGYGGTLVNDYHIPQARGYQIPDIAGGLVFDLGTMLDYESGPIIREPITSEPVGYAFAGGASNNHYAQIGTGIEIFSSMQFSVKFTLFLVSGWNQILIGPQDNKAIQITPTDWYVKADYAGDEISKSHGFTLPTYQLVEVEVRRNSSGLTELVIDGSVIDSQLYTTITNESYNTIGTALIGSGYWSNTSVLYQRVQISNETAAHDYDMLTGEHGKVTDRASGNHATIINAVGRGFLPSVPKRTFTLPFDYNDLTTVNVDAMIASADSAGERLVIELHEDALLSESVSLNPAQYQPILDGMIPFNGNYGDIDNNRYIDDTNVSLRAIRLYSSWTLRNFMLLPGGGKGKIESLREGTLLENVAAGNIYNVAEGQSATIKNSFFEGGTLATKADESKRAYLNLTNTIVTAKLWIKEFNTVRVVNGIHTPNDATLVYSDSTLELTNTLLADTLPNRAIDHGGNTFAKDFSGAFKDSVNKDYRVLKPWADTHLLSSGVGNTDIAEWSWVDVEIAIASAVGRQVNRSQKVGMTQLQSLAGAIARQLNKSTQGSISLGHTLDAVTALQQNKGTAGSAGLVHLLGQATGRQINYSAPLEVMQQHFLETVTARQVNKALTPSLSGGHFLEAYPVRQVNKAMRVSTGQLHLLGMTTGHQANRTQAAQLVQSHLLSSAMVRQINQAARLTLAQQNKLAAKAARQINRALKASLGQAGDLIAQFAKQVNRGVNAGLLQEHLIGGLKASQINKASPGSLVQTHEVGMTNARQINRVTNSALEQISKLSQSAARQINQSQLIELAITLDLLSSTARQINRAGGQAVLQIHQLSGSVAKQINRALPARLFTGILTPIDPDGLVLIDVTDAFSLQNETDQFNLQN